MLHRLPVGDDPTSGRCRVNVSSASDFIRNPWFNEDSRKSGSKVGRRRKAREKARYLEI
jgi:hypothetical protein